MPSPTGLPTGWVGKWHLHTGLGQRSTACRSTRLGAQGRDRLGFDYWRAYNQHMVYFDGFVQIGDWNYERWDGYETDGLLKLRRSSSWTRRGDDPFLLFLSPHPPHYTPFDFAPQRFYDALPDDLELPPNVPEHQQAASKEMYRHYLAMVLAIDAMLGRLLDYLEEKGLADNTIVVLASDHGTQGGSQGVNPWSKKNPYDASLRVPGLLRYPGRVAAGSQIDSVINMVDWMPTLCGLAGLTVPRSVEGRDLSGLVLGGTDNLDDGAFIMNFSKWFDWFQNGAEWRGVRTRDHCYSERLDGRVELYDLREDPWQQRNVAGQGRAEEVALKDELAEHQSRRGDALVPCTDWAHWLDDQRRVVKNAFGELSHPESEPDWSLLR